MTYNLAQIMKQAWADHLSIGVVSLAKMSAKGRKGRFANCLRNVWSRVRRVVRPVLSAVETIRQAIFCYEQMDHQSFADRRALSDLHTALHRALANETAALAA
jgi:hypothetical protein